MSATSPARPTLANLRDVGGLTVPGQGTIRHGVLLRSDAPYRNDHAPDITPWPPATIIDLRSADELFEAHPFASLGEQLITLDLLAGADPVRLASSTDTTDMSDLYRSIAAQLHRHLPVIVDAITESVGATLIHCSAGKDRTGVLVAVLLRGLGVPATQILSDYERTRTAMPAVFERALRWQTPAIAAAVRASRRDSNPRMTTSPTALTTVLQHLDTSAGGVSQWIHDSGVTPEQWRTLSDKLIDRRVAKEG